MALRFDFATLTVYVDLAILAGGSLVNSAEGESDWPIVFPEYVQDLLRQYRDHCSGKVLLSPPAEVDAIVAEMDLTPTERRLLVLAIRLLQKHGEKGSGSSTGPGVPNRPRSAPAIL